MVREQNPTRFDRDLFRKYSKFCCFMLTKYFGYFFGGNLHFMENQTQLGVLIG